ncbi:hypothetical protein [Cesiribacter andamanensis]|uniref:Uncharacterized protein n=1 Tax=Cesiribacter andamanensis AMV16 TaxID=1279009 RepID=M7N3K4_9BACT|nr:hypothetical protein [Cesiribacter andamanensis]EMR01877.1 hypothetical protein ADICEAN_02979 [Cesiribacter andamanensis AMV16]
MKYLIIVFFALMSGGAMAQGSSVLAEQESLQMELDRVLIDRLLALGRVSHTGTPVADFLNTEEVQGYSDMMLRYTPSGAIDYLMVQYSPKVFLSIYAEDSDRIAQPAAHPEAALEAFRKLPISKIGVRFIMLQEGSRQAQHTLE